MDQKVAPEALIPKFKYERLLNQDQNGRRINLLGSIDSKPALLTAERAAFPSSPETIASFLSAISSVEPLGANDVYHWYLASTKPTASGGSSTTLPSLKLNLIYPCTPKHISKYSSQAVRMVTETPFIYRTHVLPLIKRDRSSGRLDWIFNIIEGRTEQEDIILRSHDTPTGSLTEVDQEGFLLLPDLNWDRKTMTSLHLLALVERRDIWSLRDLRKKHVSWLRTMREKVLDATVEVYGKEGVERDMLKLYVHYQPTYYHFHIHVVHVMLEPSGPTQSVGKAFSLENLISQLDTMGPSSSSPSRTTTTTTTTTTDPKRSHNDKRNSIAGDHVLPIPGRHRKSVIEVPADTDVNVSGSGAGDDGNGDEKERGMQDVELTYFLGEESELWKDVFGPLKRGELARE